MGRRRARAGGSGRARGVGLPVVVLVQQSLEHTRDGHGSVGLSALRGTASKGQVAGRRSLCPTLDAAAELLSITMTKFSSVRRPPHRARRHRHACIVSKISAPDCVRTEKSGFHVSSYSVLCCKFLQVHHGSRGRAGSKSSSRPELRQIRRPARRLLLLVCPRSESICTRHSMVVLSVRSEE